MQVQQAQQLLEAQNDADAVISDLREKLVTLELEKDHALTYAKVKEEESAKRLTQEQDTFTQSMADL